MCSRATERPHSARRHPGSESLVQTVSWMTIEMPSIYIEVEDNEVRNLTGWKSGWYLIIMTPVEAKRRLGVL